MDAAIFWEAFKDAGMLEVATIASGPHAGRDLDVGFTQPGLVVFGGAVQAVSYGIEYPTSAAPALALDNRLRIGRQHFRCSEHPAPKDSLFTTVPLELLP